MSLIIIILAVLPYQGLSQTLGHPLAEVHLLLTKHKEKQRAELVINWKHLQLCPTSSCRFSVLLAHINIYYVTCDLGRGGCSSHCRDHSAVHTIPVVSAPPCPSSTPYQGTKHRRNSSNNSNPSHISVRAAAGAASFKAKTKLCLEK